MPFRFNPFSSNFDIIEDAAGISAVIALNGDTGQAVPDGSDEISIVGGDTTDNNSDGVTVVAGTSTVTVTLTNRFQATGSTVGAATDDLITFDLSSFTTGIVRFNFEVVGRDATAANGVGYSISSTFLIAGGVATRISSAWSIDNESASLTDSAIDMVASGSNAVLRATGAAGATLSWTAIGSYIVG